MRTIECLFKTYIPQTIDRYNMMLRDYPDDTPYPSFAEWLYHELHRGRYARVTRIVAKPI